MSKVLVSENNLSAIADSIRAKNGTQETYTPGEMSVAIDNLPSGGGGDQGDNNAVVEATITVPITSSSKLNPYIKKLPTMDFSNVTSMKYVFQYCSILEELTVSGTENVINMQFSFGNCPNLKKVNGLNTSSVTIFENIFYECNSLEEAPQMDTSKADNIISMFYNCRKIKSIPQYDFGLVTNAQSAFSGCNALEDVPLLDMSSATNMNSMFQNCYNLTDESLNNILLMCVNATSYTGNKTFRQLGFYRTYQPASRIQALSNYQAFIDAGWTTGY